MLVPEVVTWCRTHNVVIIPGTQTPSEAYAAYKAGAPVQKIFPGVAGGAAWVKAVKGALPMLQLNPTSGVDLDNAGDFVQLGCSARRPPARATALPSRSTAGPGARGSQPSPSPSLSPLRRLASSRRSSRLTSSPATSARRPPRRASLPPALLLLCTPSPAASRLQLFLYCRWDVVHANATKVIGNVKAALA